MSPGAEGNRDVLLGAKTGAADVEFLAFSECSSSSCSADPLLSGGGEVSS